MQNAIETMLKQLFNGNENAGSDVLGLTGQTFADAITAQYNAEDPIMLQRLIRNVWHFSAAKTYTELQELTNLLHDEKGKLRSFAQFKELAKTKSDIYNVTWLQTEYNYAVNAATMASKWAEFEQSKDDFPYLQYRTVGDNRVRDSHRAIDHTTKHINDEFWNRYYPPNGWGCRCTVIQLPVGTIRELSENTPNIPVPEMFSTNLAKAGLIFPPGHPFYGNDTPRNVLIDALSYTPEEYFFRKVADKNIQIHALHGAAELEGNLRIADKLQAYFENETIYLMPEIGGEMDWETRKKIFGKTVFDRKCPDFRIGNELWDGKEFTVTHKESGSKKSFNEYYDDKLQHELHKKGKQANNIIIMLKENVNEDVIANAANSYLNQSTKKREVIIISGDKVFSYKTSKE